ncbi:MAG: ERAP1-like C-terminal domain-containing protein [Spirochaetota bacterium]
MGRARSRRLGRGAAPARPLRPLDRYLEYLRSYCARETDPIVLVEIAQALASFHAVLPDDERVTTAGLELLGLHRDRALTEPSDDEPYDAVLLRDPVLTTLVLLGDEAVTSVLLDRAKTIRSGQTIHADSVPLALHAGVAVDPSFIGWIQSRLEDPNLPEARSLQFIRALAGVRDRAGIDEVLRLVTEGVPHRNRLHFLRPAGGNPDLYPHLVHRPSR